MEIEDYSNLQYDDEEYGSYDEYDEYDEYNNDMMIDDPDDFEIKEEKKEETFGAIGSQPYKTDNLANILSNTLSMLNQIEDKKPLTMDQLYKIADDNKFNEKDIMRGIEQFNYPVQHRQIGSTFSCQSCWGDFNYKHGYTLSCKHYLCISCYKEYAEQAVKSGKKCAILPCAHGCENKLTFKDMKELLKPSSFKKYKSFFQNRIVDMSCNYKWCPGKRCDRVIQLFSPDYKLGQINIHCKNCDTNFCLKCSSQAHRPLNCDLFKEWDALTSGKNKDVNELWIKANCKPCPSCKSNIQKNQGCMHMTCKQCRYEFCWLCGDDWKKTHGEKTGGFYKCNLYRPAKHDKEQNKAKVKMQKFNFYEKRFTEHLKGIKQNLNLKIQKEKQMNALMFQVANNQDYKFYIEALEICYQSRRVVAWTFPIGYFLANVAKKNCFEFIQLELLYYLEQTEQYILVSNLDRFIKHDNTDGTAKLESEFFDFRSTVISKTKMLTQYFNNVLKEFEADMPSVKVQLPKLKLGKKKQSIYSTFGQQVKKDNKHWYCFHCTMRNVKKNKKCEMCRKKKKQLR